MLQWCAEHLGLQLYSPHSACSEARVHACMQEIAGANSFCGILSQLLLCEVLMKQKMVSSCNTNCCSRTWQAVGEAGVIEQAAA